MKEKQMMRIELSIEFPESDQVTMWKWFWKTIAPMLWEKGVYENSEITLISRENKVIVWCGKPLHKHGDASKM